MRMMDSSIFMGALPNPTPARAQARSIPVVGTGENCVFRRKTD